jgi:hypothetical protein
MYGFPKMGLPQNGWMVYMEKPEIKWMGGD